MGSLALLIVSAIATSIFYFARVRRQPNNRGWSAAKAIFVALYALTLLLALRLGGRTYPGVWFPKSALLNWLFNGVTIFTEIGYDAVALGAVLHIGSFWLKGRARGVVLTLSAGLALLAVCISAYGFVWAVSLQRLP